MNGLQFIQVVIYAKLIQRGTRNRFWVNRVDLLLGFVEGKRGLAVLLPIYFDDSLVLGLPPNWCAVLSVSIRIERNDFFIIKTSKVRRQTVYSEIKRCVLNQIRQMLNRCLPSQVYIYATNSLICRQADMNDFVVGRVLANQIKYL